MFVHRLALELHCPISDIMALPLSELLDWLEYFSKVNAADRGEVDPEELNPEQLARAFGASVS